MPNFIFHDAMQTTLGYPVTWDNKPSNNNDNNKKKQKKKNDRSDHGCSVGLHFCAEHRDVTVALTF